MYVRLCERMFLKKVVDFKFLLYINKVIAVKML